MASKIPEITIKLESKIVTGGKNIKMTVRNMFYHGFFGKINVIWNWYWYRSYNTSFLAYLDEPVTYSIGCAQDLSAFHNIDAEAELSELLQKEFDKEFEIELEKEIRKRNEGKTNN